MSDVQNASSSYVAENQHSMTKEKPNPAFQFSSAPSSSGTTVIEIDVPPSYEAVHPIPPCNNDMPAIHPHLAETVYSSTKLISGQNVVGFGGFSTLYYAPDVSTLIKEDQKHDSHHIWVTIAGTVIIAAGLDLLWATFAFCYVVTTWTTAVVCMIVPILGLPLYFIFAISWRALAHVDLILSTSFFPTVWQLKPCVPLPLILFPVLHKHIMESPSADALREDPAPPLAKSDYTWRTGALTMFALSTWRAIIYFTIPRFVLSLLAFCLFWLIIFPFWLLFGVGCLGFMWTPGRTMWPMVKLMAVYPGLAVSLLSERKF
ncbi:hypothetical protein BJ742DRAFT_260542 [Cladochytrium replicatum]|nr:hypothetical protein BJ742DRAFT_260542 [Cladochytrium replicatum]